MNITNSGSKHIITPLSVKESPIRFEFTLREVIPISELPSERTLILLDVKSTYVRDDLYKNGIVDTIGKMGGDHFSINGNIISLERPRLLYRANSFSENMCCSL